MEVKITPSLVKQSETKQSHIENKVKSHQVKGKQRKTTPSVVKIKQNKTKPSVVETKLNHSNSDQCLPLHSLNIFKRFGNRPKVFELKLSGYGLIKVSFLFSHLVTFRTISLSEPC